MARDAGAIKRSSTIKAMKRQAAKSARKHR